MSKSCSGYEHIDWLVVLEKRGDQQSLMTIVMKMFQSAGGVLIQQHHLPTMDKGLDVLSGNTDV